MIEVVLDGCCFINLYATGEVRSILRALGWSWHLPQIALREALFIRAKDEHGEVVKVPIEAQSLVEEGLIRHTDVVAPEEMELYVRFAGALDDGEAMALAIAKQRAWELASDDAKAIRCAIAHDVEVVTTPEILRAWAAAAKASPAEIADVLHRIEFGAHFLPNRRSPAYEWWIACRECRG